MNTPLGAVRALLWFSLGWGLLLVLLSFVMPIATLSSGYVGAQSARGTIKTCPATSATMSHWAGGLAG